MGSKNIEFAVKALIINENNKVLLVHKPIYPSHVFELPGGRMEFGETAEENLKNHLHSVFKIRMEN